MFGFIGKQLKPYVKLVVLVIVFQIGQTLLSVYLPRINAGIIDYGVANGDIGYIINKGMLMLSLSIIQFLCAIGAGILGAKTALSTGRDLRKKIYTKILSYSQKEVAVFGAPTLITRATNDVEQIIQFLTVALTVIVATPIMFVVGVIMALAQSVALSVVVLITVPILLIITVILLLYIVPYFSKQQARIDDTNGILRDQITGVRVARAFVQENFEKKRFGKVNNELYKIGLVTSQIPTLMIPLFMFIVNAATVAVLWYGGRLALSGGVQVGEIIAFITYLSFILTATLSSSVVFIMLPRAQVSAKRIIELLDAESSIEEREDPVSLNDPRGVIKFENVSYSYAPDDPDVKPVLKNISFTAKPGTKTAIIGSTGSGKTTLLNIIPRLTDATGGRVLFDGVDIKELKKTELDAAIGMVPQKSFLFGGSLKQNILYAKSDADDDEIWDALRVAQAEEFIREKDDGINMRVSEGGANYSGGQRQRLAITRAIVRRPKVYLFDDSFSALDYATDKKLRAALKEISSDATVIVVAQRVASIKDADNIIVLNNGEIEDMGTHSELIERCATYIEIASTQPEAETEASA